MYIFIYICTCTLLLSRFTFCSFLPTNNSSSHPLFDKLAFNWSGLFVPFCPFLFFTPIRTYAK